MVAVSVIDRHGGQTRTYRAVATSAVSLVVASSLPSASTSQAHSRGSRYLLQSVLPWAQTGDVELIVPIVVTVLLFIAILKRHGSGPLDQGPTRSDMTTLNLHD